MLFYASGLHLQWSPKSEHLAWLHHPSTLPQVSRQEMTGFEGHSTRAPSLFGTLMRFAFNPFNRVVPSWFRHQVSAQLAVQLFKVWIAAQAEMTSFLSTVAAAIALPSLYKLPNMLLDVKENVVATFSAANIDMLQHFGADDLKD